MLRRGDDLLASGRICGKLVRQLSYLILLAGWNQPPGVAQAQQRLLTPEDIITLPRVAEVRLSPDGRHITYGVRVRDLKTNVDARSFRRVATRGGATDSLRIDSRAHHLRWRPDGEALTYIAPDSSRTGQIWQYIEGERPRKLTSQSHSILSYEWSPDGRRLAFTRSLDLPRADSERAGVVIDNMRFFFRRLLSKEPLRQADAHYGDPPARVELWIYDLESHNVRQVSGAMSVSGYSWSPDGRRLAVTASDGGDRLPKHLAPHDLLLYSVADHVVSVLESGADGDHLDDTVIYQQPFWSPDGSRIGYFRRDLRDRWAASPQVGVFSLPEQRTILFIGDEALELYDPKAFWLYPDTVVLETTLEGSRGLIAVAVSDGSVRRLDDAAAWSAQHSFSADGRYVAFVREWVGEPAEIHLSVCCGTQDSQQLTQLHGALEGTMTPKVEGFRWTSDDGVEVDGWLYLPAGGPPYATLVFLHGGPTWVYGNQYEPYVPYWPYVLGVFAARGIAVFVPNYRGTGSYGKMFRMRSALDEEPVNDVVAGLDALVGRGVADPERLGIAGHSHGCWLGALIAVRERRFVTGACAEGTANLTTTYAGNAGWMNAEIVNHYWGAGASPYGDPETYRKLSPVYGFQGLRTSFLFEAGELSLALNGVEFATAAWAAGVPHELVIYRNTDHNVVEPRPMLESALRNLEWFEFWLLDREYPDEAKQVQYERWRKLKENAGREMG